MVGVGDGGKEVEGCMDQLMGLGECETVHSSSAFEQWDSYWEDLTRYWLSPVFIYLLDLIRFVSMVPVIKAIHFLCCAFVAPMSLVKQ